MLICYMGDDHLGGAAIYLCGVMTHFGIAFDHVRSDEAPPADFSERRYEAYVVSDYPAAMFGEPAMRHVVDRVRGGSGLVMLGGWESFFGRLGEYHDSPLAEALPVVMQNADDRCNQSQPCMIRREADHAILEGLPWETPPGIGGYNRIAPKPDAQLLLSAVPFEVKHDPGHWRFLPQEKVPLLVVGQFGSGRTAALATDAAPHWVGGFVDWGNERVTRTVGAGFIEVGNWYARFFGNLIRWAAEGVEV